jgi:hypothetical protein
MLILRQLALDPATQIFFLAPLALIALDVLTGVIGALVNKAFHIGYLADFARNNLLPYVSLLITFLAVPMISGIPYLVAANSAKAVVSIFCVSLLHSIFANVAQIGGKSSWVYAVDNAINSGMERLFPSVMAGEAVPAPDALTPNAIPVPSTDGTAGQ